MKTRRPAIGFEGQTKGLPHALQNVGVTAAILLAAIGLCLLLDQIDDVDHADAYVSMVFVLAILLVARSTDGYAYGVAASLAGVLLVNYFFTYPYFAFNFTLPGYPITMICMLGVSILTSTLTSRIKRQQHAYMEAEREKTRSNLLRAVSHDLRTPLTSILGANSAIMENDDSLTREQRLKLRGEINEEALWLIRMVENLLTITRIDGSREARIVKTSEAVEEVVAEAVAKFAKRFPHVAFEVRAPDTLLLCPMDAILIEQVLVNFLENAALHAVGMTHVALSVEQRGGRVRFAVRDDGCGIPRDQLAHLFDGSPRAAGTSDDHKRNMGIGLSVCNSIIRAHGGSLEAVNCAAGGAEFSFTLPLEEDHRGESEPYLGH